MRVYLDMCCLKRPFDDQAQPRIHFESEAVLALLNVPALVEFVGGPALDLENDQNPVLVRASRVAEWLAALPSISASDPHLETRTTELIALGFKSFDAFHLACAELGGAEVFCSCDDRLLALAARHANVLQVRTLNPFDLAQEVFS